MYIGTFIIPSRLFHSFYAYVDHQIEQKRLSLHEPLAPINTQALSFSLTEYNSDQGWSEWSYEDYSRFVRILKSTNTSSLPNSPLVHYQILSDYNNQKTPVICDLLVLLNKLKTKFYFTYDSLPWTKSTPKNGLTDSEKDTIRKLVREGHLSVIFLPLQLLEDYSLDYYVMITPKLLPQQLSHLIQVLPKSSIAQSSHRFFIGAYLTSQLASIFKQELQWSVFPILFALDNHKIDSKWYDFSTQTWKTPQLLEEYL